MTSRLRMPRAPLDSKPDTVRCDNSLSAKPTLKPCPLPFPDNSFDAAAAHLTVCSALLQACAVS